MTRKGEESVSRANGSDTFILLSHPSDPSIWPVRDVGSVPGSRRSPGGRHGNPLQYSCLENPTKEPGGLQSMGLQIAGHD